MQFKPHAYRRSLEALLTAAMLGIVVWGGLIIFGVVPPPGGERFFRGGEEATFVSYRNIEYDDLTRLDP